jgi:very-short-patch-repair endonuclease
MARHGPTIRTDPSAVEATIFKSQLGLATRAQLLNEGVSERQIHVALTQGRWLRTAWGLYALSNWPPDPTRGLLAACLATSGVASFTSAAWLWGLLKDEPPHLTVSVQHGRTPAAPPTPPKRGRRPFPSGPNGLLDLSSLVVHHSRDLSSRSISNWRGVPTTNPLRTLVDLAAVSGSKMLDEAVDLALAKRLATVEALEAEAARLKHPGRRGPALLVDRLEARSFAGAPSPSVLESRALRLLANANIKVGKCEVVVDEGRYRLDIEVGPQLFVEVDGFAFHWGPEQKHRDDMRRNQLRLRGFEILVYDWEAIVKERHRVVKEVRAALETKATARHRPLTHTKKWATQARTKARRADGNPG